MTAATYNPSEVLNPDHRLMEVLSGLMGWAKKHYVYPSQEKIRELLARFTGRAMSLRTLNRHLRALERDGHLLRVRRLAERPAGVFCIRTTLYFLRGRWLARASRLTTAFRGWQRAITQRDAQRRVTGSAHNMQPHTAINDLTPVDNRPPG